MLADYHIHTEVSEDSKMSMLAYAKRALELGFNEICFTDHVEFAYKSPIVKGEIDYYQNYKDFLENFGDNKGLITKFGAEFGIQKDNINDFKNFYKKYPFDFVLLSTHTIENKGLFDGYFQKGKSQKEYNEAYYSHLLKVVRNFKDYSVLAHVDLIRRYDTSYYALEHTYPFVSEILKQAISDGKGIEINTSCFRYNIPDLTPSLEIINLYKKLGGEIITIGSDSHDISHFGCKILQIQKQLSEIGFKAFHTFNQMIPESHNLIK